MRIALITEGKDPDQLIRNDQSKWNNILSNAVSAIDFLIEAEAKKLDLSSSQGKSELVERVLPLVFSIPDWNEQDRYLQKLADTTAISRDQLRMIAGSWSRKQQYVSRNASSKARAEDKVESVFAVASEDPLEKRAITLLLQHEDLWDNRFDLKIDFFMHAANRAILSAIHAESTMIGAQAELDQQFKERGTQLSQLHSPPSDKKLRDEEWAACVRRLEERYLRELKSLEGAAFENGGGDSGSAEYIGNVEQQALETNNRLRELFAGNSH